MSNETRLIRERLIELMDEGRLSGQSLAFDGEPLTEQAESPEYRPDGYSYATHKGCRRHRLVDERLDELEKGDDVERRVADEFPRWFCFDPRDSHYPEMVANDDGAKIAQEAFSNAMIRTYWLVAGSSAQQRILPADFVTGPNEDREFHDECRVIFSNRDNLPAQWPPEALENIDEFIDRIRNPSPWS